MDSIRNSWALVSAYYAAVGGVTPGYLESQRIQVEYSSWVSSSNFPDVTYWRF
jgi:hypothetical protein